MTTPPDPPIAPVQTLWGGFETLNTVSTLAGCLMHRWPAKGHGEEYLTALMVCEAILRGGEGDTAEDARAAFMEAVHEAGLSVSSDDDGPDF